MKKAEFWGGTHPLTEAFETLNEELVPAQGNAPTQHGELLRCMARLYHDVYNNGFGNREVLFGNIVFVQSLKDAVVPFLEDSKSWRRGLENYLVDVGKANEGEDPDQMGAKLEDIMAAVVKYVAHQAGLALPATVAPAFA
jgi:hypothetical protein